MFDITEQEITKSMMSVSVKAIIGELELQIEWMNREIAQFTKLRKNVKSPSEFDMYTTSISVLGLIVKTNESRIKDYRKTFLQ